MIDTFTVNKHGVVTKARSTLEINVSKTITVDPDCKLVVDTGVSANLPCPQALTRQLTAPTAHAGPASVQSSAEGERKHDKACESECACEPHK